MLVSAGFSLYGVYRVAVRYWDFGAASRELPAAVERYRADGLPFLARDLLPTPVSPEKNAAPAIRAAMRAMPPEGTKPTSALYDKPLALLAAAKDRPKVDFKRDWDLGPNVLLPEYAPMKTLAKALVLRAEGAARRGDDAAALRDLVLARRIALWAGEEPTLISLLVRIAAEGIALRGAERCLVLVAKSPARIARYAAWLADAPPLPDFGDALKGETFLGVATARNLDLIGGVSAFGNLQGGEDATLLEVDPAKLRRSGVPDDVRTRGFLARHLQFWDEAYRTTDRFQAPPEAIGRRLDVMSARIEGEKGLSYVLLRILVPVFGQAGEAVVALKARRAVDAAFAEALGVHARTGVWPASVSGSDPFTGGPLRVRAGKGFRVWSVGRDRKDDGGLLRSERPKGTKGTFDEGAVYP